MAVGSRSRTDGFVDLSRLQRDTARCDRRSSLASVTDSELGPVGRFVLFGMLFLDPKLIDFSTNGQEAGILVFFAVLLWSELEARMDRAPTG